MEQTPKTETPTPDAQAKPSDSSANPNVISVNPQGDAKPVTPAASQPASVPLRATVTPPPATATPAPRRYKPIILPEDDHEGFDHGHGHPFILLVRRTLAFLVDTLGIGTVAAMFGYQLMLSGKLPLTQDEQGFTRLFALSLGAALVLLFLFEWIFGTSVGKLIFGLHVRRVSGQRAGFGHTFWRNLFRLVEIVLIPIAVIMILALRHRQRIGDKLTDTTVGRSPIGPFSTIMGLLIVGALAWAVAEYGGGAATFERLRDNARPVASDLYQRAVTFFTSHSNAQPAIPRQPSSGPTPS